MNDWLERSKNYWKNYLIGKSDTRRFWILVERRPEVERAVELASGDVHAGWQARL